MKKYLKLILEEGRRLSKDYDYLTGKNLHAPKCAACLAADARSNVDEKLGDEGPCLAEGDPYMLEAKSILSKELKWPLEGEEEPEIISKNEFNEDKHDHLEDLKCPQCGNGMKLLKNRNHLVGCGEYQIFICDREPYFIREMITGKKEALCKTLVINYPHDSAEKKNKIIKIL